MKTYTFAEAMAARAEGKRVKMAVASEWGDHYWDMHHVPHLEKQQWHIETPPTQVPWDCPEDVPMVVAFRCKGAQDRCYPICVLPSGVWLTAEDRLSWSELAEGYEHTLNGINWKPCTKESK